MSLLFGAGDYKDRGDWTPRDDLLLIGDENEVVWYNLDAIYVDDANDANTVSIRASGGLTESYKMRWPIDSGEPNSVLMTPGDPNAQLVWAVIDANLVDLTASLLVATDASKALESVADLTSWIAGTANRITVTDDADGTVTLSTPQDIHTGASVDFNDLTLSGDTLIIATSKTPSSASDTGTTGHIAWDTNYIYVAVAANTWKRSALTTWEGAAENVIYAAENVIFASEQVVYP